MLALNLHVNRASFESKWADLDLYAYNFRNLTLEIGQNHAAVTVRELDVNAFYCASNTLRPAFHLISLSKRALEPEIEPLPASNPMKSFPP